MLVLGFLVAASLTAWSGCTGGDRSADNDNTNVKPIVMTERRGPVTLTLTVSHEAPTLSDRVHVLVEAVAAPDVVVELDDYGGAMRKQDFGYKIVDQTTTTAVPTQDGRLLWRQDYAVDFLVTGSHEFPPAKLKYTDERRIEAEPEAVQTLETESITVTVDAGAPMEFTDEQLAEVKMPAPLEMSEPQEAARRRWWIAGVVAAALLLAAATVWWLVRRSRRPRPEVVIPPHEWARAELGKLLAAGLIEAGQVQEFYFRLSGIVREYVERRFDLHVPEMTTEEFLEAAMAGEILGGDVKAALGRFLEACDMVKFALYSPGRNEVDEAVSAAVGFVDRTQPRAELMPPSSVARRGRQEQPA
ncbi:MAG: hypothetical protein C4547_07195 [Phycisphaerales bacterium]|nr:MAG: hypothetical protein C4547_07195 [Phycisphaerales bacterium]